MDLQWRSRLHSVLQQMESHLVDLQEIVEAAVSEPVPDRGSPQLEASQVLTMEVKIQDGQLESNIRRHAVQTAPVNALKRKTNSVKITVRHEWEIGSDQSLIDFYREKARHAGGPSMDPDQASCSKRCKTERS